MPRKSWQASVYQVLLEAGENWVRAGGLYAPIESDIPLHTASRHVLRHRDKEENPSPSMARWKLFTFYLSHMGVEWERRGKARFDGDRCRLRARAKCRFCGGNLYKVTWSSASSLRCAQCGYATNDGRNVESDAVEVITDTNIDDIKTEQANLHPLIGYGVTRMDGRGNVELRNGTIIEVISSGSQPLGDICVVSYENQSRVDMVAIAEFADVKGRHYWRLRLPSGELRKAAE